MSEKKVPVYKFTIPTGKVICLREPKISDTNTATQIAGKRAGNNQAHLAVTIQQELIKLLLVSVDDKTLSNAEKERLDDLFSLKEYASVIKAVGMITGDDDEGELKMEFTTTGA